MNFGYLDVSRFTGQLHFFDELRFLKPHLSKFLSKHSNFRLHLLYFFSRIKLQISDTSCKLLLELVLGMGLPLKGDGLQLLLYLEQP